MVASGAASGLVADLLVVGGGINGAGIARDASGRGLSVVLCEQGDLAGATSSASTKLIHGGLRYLEHYEFRLVREALTEREVLWRAAPHIIRPLRFVLPHDPAMRPAWLLRLGLFLYDHLGGRERLPASRGLDLTRHPAGQPLVPGVVRGFEYSDCWVEDSRLVVLNAMDAEARGARILTRTRLLSARREGGLWRATLGDLQTGASFDVLARALVNAAGPWVAELLGTRLSMPARHRIRLVKGSHIVVPRIFEGDHAYILQNDDGRIVFAIPYERRFTLIGTTDLDYVGDPGDVTITPDEIAYLCAAASRWFAKPVQPADVAWTYSGVRPLQDDAEGDASKVTRDYVLELDVGVGTAPLLSVFGGKITTFRRLAEEAVEKLGRLLDHDAPRWTRDAPLPGGDMPGADFEGFVQALGAEFPWLPPALRRRYAGTYGTLARELLAGIGGPAGLGACLGCDVHEIELRWAREREFARSGEDFLWRRSKLGLHLAPAERRAVEDWFVAAEIPVRAAG